MRSSGAKNLFIYVFLVMALFMSVSSCDPGWKYKLRRPSSGKNLYLDKADGGELNLHKLYRIDRDLNSKHSNS